MGAIANRRASSEFGTTFRIRSDATYAKPSKLAENYFGSPFNCRRRVKAKLLSIVAAGKLLKLSYRQAKRVWRRYEDKGDKGLVHCGRGRVGNRRKAAKMRERIMARYKERYPDFGPTLAAEHLGREGLVVDHETLRQWLLAKGWWTIKRRRQKHRQWRERRACFGELVQMDGSHHDWFEGRRDRAVLMVMIDDATNRTYARFSEQETTRAAYDTFEGYVRRHKMPVGLYVDRDSIYRTEREPTVREQLAGQEPLTQFGRAMKGLGVAIELAYSPQAKGLCGTAQWSSAGPVGEGVALGCNQ